MKSFLLFLTLSIALLSCDTKKVKQVSARNTGPLAVEGFVVEPRAISEDIEVPGSLLSMEETQIRAEVGGRIVQLNIQEGTLVKKGQLLVKLFDLDLQASLRKLKVQLDINQKTVERQRDLLAINGISQQDFDLAALAVDNLKADIETIRIAISKTEIRAPYDGKLGLRNVSLGAYVSPSDILTSVRQADELKLEFAIPEKYAKNISVGYAVRFKVDGGMSNHTAAVMATEGSVDQATRTMRVRALVKERGAELVPGIFAKVNLQMGYTAAALMVPTQAIIPQARSKQLLLLRRDSVKFLSVQTGVRDSSFIQILNGLKAGDTILISGLMSVRPKSKVKLSKVSRYLSKQ